MKILQTFSVVLGLIMVGFLFYDIFLYDIFVLKNPDPLTVKWIKGNKVLHEPAFAGDVEEFGTFEMVVRVTAVEKDSYIMPDVSHVLLHSGFVFELYASGERYIGNAQCYIAEALSTEEVNGRYLVKHGQPATFRLRIKVNPDQEASGHVFWAQLKYIWTAPDSEGTSMQVVKLSNREEFQTGRLVID